MKNRHLTDEEIQQYVLDWGTCNKELLAHISQCEHCQQQAAQYQLLFASIEKQEKATFDFELADLVMEQIAQPTPAPDNRVVLYAMLAIVAAMVGVIAYLFGNSTASLFAFMQPLLIGLVIITAFGLVGFLGLDMYQKYKTQMNALNFS